MQSIVKRLRLAVAAMLSIGMSAGCSDTSSAQNSMPKMTIAPVVTYQPGVVVLNSGAAPTSATGSSQLMLRAEAAELASVQPGQVVVSGKRAYRVHSTTAEGIAVDSSEPAFEEVVESMRFAGEAPILPEHVQTLAPAVQMIRKAADVDGLVTVDKNGSNLVFTLTDFVAADLDGNTSTTYDEILVNGTVTLEMPSVSFDVDWHWFKPPTIDLGVHLGDALDLTVASPGVKFDASYTVPIAAFEIPIGAGVVAIGGKIQLILSASGEVRAAVTFNQSATVDAGLRGDGNPWKITPYSTVTSNFNVIDPELTASLKLGAYISPRLSLLVLQYDTAGIYAKLGIEADASAVITTASQCLTIGVDGYFGVNGYFKIPFYKIDKSIYSHTWPIYNNEFCNNPDPTPTPTPAPTPTPTPTPPQ